MRPSAKTRESELSPEELNFLLGLITGAKKAGAHLEIGTAAGGTLWRMMRCFSDKERPSFVVVDPMGYFPNQLETVKDNLRQHGVDPAGVDFRVMTSREAFQHAKESGERFDCILVDGVHKIRYVLDDLCWGELLNSSGILCCHDYCPKFRGVMLAVRRFLRRNTHYTVIGQVERLIAMRKTSTASHCEVTVSDKLYGMLWAPLLQLEPSIRKRLQRLRKKQ